MKNQKRFVALFVSVVLFALCAVVLTSCGECDHDYGEWIVTKEATCTTPGEAYRVCKLDSEHVETKATELAAHTYGEYVSDGKVTCTTNGTKTATCSACGYKNTVLENAIGHSFTTYIPGGEATCTTGAPEIAVCDREGCEATDVKYVGEGYGHSYGTDGVCSTCSDVKANLAKYDISAEGSNVIATIYETDKTIGTSKNIALLLKISGTGAAIDFTSDKDVPWAKDYGKRIVYVEMDDTITYVGAYTFTGLTKLAEVQLSNSLTAIPAFAFEKCEDLEELVIPASVGVIGNAAFINCSSLEEVTIAEGSNMTEIGASAFNGCKKLETINLPDSVTAIYESAFEGCKKLAAINVTTNLTTFSINAILDTKITVTTEKGANYLAVGENPYAILVSIDTKSLEEGTLTINKDTTIIPEFVLVGKTETVKAIVVEDGNTVYSAANNCIIKGNTVIMGIATSTIPEDASITTIGANAFYNCAGLTAITIPENITTIETDAFYGCSKLATVTFPDTIERIEDNAFKGCGFKSLVIPANIKYIGKYAFANCTALTSLDLPDNAEYISEGAFAGCTELTAIEIPATIGYIDNAVFYGCAKLEKVSIYFTGSDANGTASTDFAWIFAADAAAMPTIKNVYVLGNAPIAANAFANCAIENIHLSAEITKIGNGAFAGCTALKAVYITDIAAWCAVDFADYYANPVYFAKCIYLNDALVTELVIPEGVTTIGFAAFNGCASIKSVVLPSTLTTIETAAFKGCTSLTSVVIPEGVNAIGTLAFANCNVLTSVTLPTTITSLAPYVFSGCTELPTINIPASVTSISETAFIGCQRLASVTVDEANTVYVSYCGIVYTADKAIYFIPHSIAGKVVILDGVTEIKAGTFLNYPHIDTLVVPASVTTIGEAAFVGCTTLKSITLPFIGQSLDCTENTAFGYVFGTVPATLKTVTILGGTKVADGAFKDCDNISTINLPEGITSIGKEAFANCMGLGTITLPKTVTSVADDAFAECRKLRTVYYGGLEADYAGITVGANNVNFKGAKFYYFNDQPDADGDGTNWYIDADGDIVIW